MKLNQKISIGLGGTLILSSLLARVASAEPAPFMMQAMVANRPIDGQPLLWDDQQMLLMGRDGALYDFKPGDAKNAKLYGKGFVGYISK